MKTCELCGEPVKDPICSYCGFINAKITGKDTEEVAEKAKEKTREERLLNISEIGVVLKRYKSIQGSKVVCDDESYPLFLPERSNTENIEGTVRKTAVFYGKKIALYFKTKQNKVIFFDSVLQNLPEYSKNFQSFEISAQINEHLKLDAFCHINGENQDGIKVIDNIKLGSTLVTD